MHGAPPRQSLTAVILLSSNDTGFDREEFADVAMKSGCMIADAFEFGRDAMYSTDDLTDVDAVVAALSRAIAGRMDIWLPFPEFDFVREKHWRRLSLVLQRHGLNMRGGRDVYPCPIDGLDFSEIDFALRREVQAVDALDRAALAAAGSNTLEREIERSLVAAAGEPAAQRADGDSESTEGYAPAHLPPPTMPWPQRQPRLKRYVRWLVHDCGVTQAATARVLNSIKQRTATGRKWQPGTVSKLLNGDYDHAPVERSSR